MKRTIILFQFILLFLVSASSQIHIKINLPSKILDSIHKVIHIDTFDRALRESLIPNISPDHQILYRMSSYADLSKSINDYRRVEFPKIESICYFHHRKRRRYIYKNVVERKLVIRQQSGRYYYEQTDHKIHKLIRIRKRDKKETVVKLKDHSIGEVLGISILFEFENLKSQKSVFDKYNTMSWIIENATNKELKLIVKHFKFPIMQYYSMYELVERGEDIQELKSFISSEYAFIVDNKNQIVRLNQHFAKR